MRWRIRAGLSSGTDVSLPVMTWRSYTGKALEEARCVIVAWSAHSVASEWVIEEADKGKQRGILVPVRFDDVNPPLGFGGIQAADLINWQLGQAVYSLRSIG